MLLIVEQLPVWSVFLEVDGNWREHVELWNGFVFTDTLKDHTQGDLWPHDDLVRLILNYFLDSCYGWF